MLINTIGKSEVLLYKNNSQSEPFELDHTNPKKKKTALAETSRTVNFETAKTVANIASKYQIRSATAKEMASMSEELYSAGVISQDEHNALSYNREFHFDYFDDMDNGVDAEMETPPKRNFLAVWEENKLSEQQNQNQVKAERAGRLVNILQNLDLVDAGSSI